MSQMSDAMLVHILVLCNIRDIPLLVVFWSPYTCVFQYTVSPHCCLHDAISLMFDFYIICLMVYESTIVAVSTHLIFSALSVQWGALVQCYMFMKWITSAIEHNPLPNEEPHELLELVCLLECPLTEEPLLAVNMHQICLPNMEPITHPTFAVAPNPYLTDSCAWLECQLKRLIENLAIPNERAHSQVELGVQSLPWSRWHSAMPQPCWAGIECPHQVLYTHEHTVGAVV